MKVTTEKVQIRLTRASAACWRVTFDNPPLNVMGPPFVREFKEIITAVEADEAVKVLVFESAVEGFFLNHSDFLADLKDLTSLPQGPTGLEAWPDILVRITRMPVVSIALIRGRATGNGSEIALACDMSFASREKALLSQWEVGVGLVAGGGPMARLPRLMGRQRALEVLLGSDDTRATWRKRYGYVEPVAAGQRTRWLRRCAGEPHRIFRQVGDREHEASRECQPAAGRRDRRRLGGLHGLDRAAGCAGQDQGFV